MDLKLKTEMMSLPTNEEQAKLWKKRNPINVKVPKHLKALVQRVYDRCVREGVAVANRDLREATEWQALQIFLHGLEETVPSRWEAVQRQIDHENDPDYREYPEYLRLKKKFEGK
jgi:hypothetical protein